MSSILELGVKIRERRLANNWDAVIAVCGGEGVGKSTFAIELAQAIDPNFELERNILFNPTYEGIRKTILETPPGTAIVIDEAIKIMFKRDWMNKFQRFMVKFFGVCREQRKAIILCMPRFTDFDIYFRNHRIIIWVQVLSRGLAAAHARDMTPYVADPWWLKENQKKFEETIGRHKLFETKMGDVINAMHHMKNAPELINFPPLPDDLHSNYRAIKSKVVYEMQDDQDDRAGRLEKFKKACARACTVLYTEYGCYQAKLADITGLGMATVNALLKTEGVRPFDIEKKKEKPLESISVPPPPLSS